MNKKILFDEITKIITIIKPPINNEIIINVKRDFYSIGKEEWVAKEHLRKFLFPFYACGGNSLPNSKTLDTTFFISADWKIRPFEADHRLIIYGDIYSYDGSDFFLNTLGNFNVHISILRQ